MGIKVEEIQSKVQELAKLLDVPLSVNYAGGTGWRIYVNKPNGTRTSITASYPIANKEFYYFVIEMIDLIKKERSGWFKAIKKEFQES